MKIDLPRRPIIQLTSVLLGRADIFAMAEEEKIKKIGKKCCIFNCANTDLNEKGIHFYRVVRSRSQEQSDKWIQIIKQQNGANWSPTKDTRICSSHFLGGEFSSDANHPDYLPTIFANSSIKPAKESDVSRFNRRISRDHSENVDSRPKS